MSTPSATQTHPLVAGWLDTLQVRGLAPATIAVYRKTANRFSNDLDPLTVGPGEAAGWVEATYATHSGRQMARNVIRRFLGWLDGTGQRHGNPIPKGSGPAGFGPPRTGPGPAWAGPIRDYDAYLRAIGRSTETRHTRTRALTLFGQDHPDGPATVTGEQIISYFAANPHWKPATRKSVRASLLSFYRWAMQFGVVDSNPAMVLPSFKVPAGVPRPVDDLVFADAMRTTVRDRDRLMILLAAHAGLRRSEIAALHSDNITDHGLHITGKGGRSRLIPLTAELRRELRAAGPGWIFPARFGRNHVHPSTVARVLTEAMEGQATAHQLRHRFATRAYAGTKNIRAVQTLLGHSDPATTAIYVAVADEDLKAAVAAAAS